MKGDKRSIFLTFIILFSFWILLSGIFEGMDLLLGMICSIIVALVSHDLWHIKSVPLRKIFRFIAYIPWLAYKIILANLDVAYRVLHPKMPIDPRIIEFKTEFDGDLALTTLANSITLTPGTITVDIKDGVYSVHALTTKAADELLEGKMQRKVAHIGS
jgi:multicomponent Na+:H+ antiporter subunit E